MRAVDFTDPAVLVKPIVVVQLIDFVTVDEVT